MNNHLNEEKILGGCCGRPMYYNTTPKCNYNSCCMNEYAYKQKACIRNKQPDCEAQAVIPSITVETVDGITNLANCFVHVSSTNTTYYVDDKHRVMITWAGNVEVNLPETVQTEEEWEEFVKSFDLREQFLYIKRYDNDNNKNIINAFYFDKTGKIYFAGEFEEMIIGGGLN